MALSPRAVHDPNRAIAIRLHDEHYAKLVIGDRRSRRHPAAAITAAIRVG
jgi:hypothetical protein